MNNFRLLKSSEISPEVASVNKGGAKILLWQKNFAAQDILDETLGATNWHPEFRTEDGHTFCKLTICVDGKEIVREGVGAKNGIKSSFEDAMSNAAVHVGIGRELYTAPEIFFFSSDLKGYVEKEDGSVFCNDIFKCENVRYDEDRNITSVSIGVYRYPSDEQPYFKKSFSAGSAHKLPETSEEKKEEAKKTHSETKATSNSKTSTKEKQEAKKAVKEDKTVKPEEPKAEKPEEVSESSDSITFTDDEVMLIGSLRGSLYKDIKNSKTFEKLVEWAKANDSRKYNDEKIQKQFMKLLAC